MGKESIFLSKILDKERTKKYFLTYFRAFCRSKNQQKPTIYGHFCEFSKTHCSTWNGTPNPKCFTWNLYFFNDFSRLLDCFTWNADFSIIWTYLTHFMVDLLVMLCAKVHKWDAFGLFAPKKWSCRFCYCFEALSVICSLKLCAWFSITWMVGWYDSRLIAFASEDVSSSAHAAICELPALPHRRGVVAGVHYFFLLLFQRLFQMISRQNQIVFNRNFSVGLSEMFYVEHSIL